MGIEALLLSQVITISGSTGQVVTKQANGTLALQDAASAGISGSTGATDNAILRADGTGGATLQSSNLTIDDLYTASPNNVTNYACAKVEGGTTNVGLALVPKGTGAFSLAVPDGTTTGGNARGANAVDFQTSRSAASQVASGSNSFLCGENGRASGAASVAFSNTATGTGAIALPSGSPTSGAASGAYSFLAGSIWSNASGNNSFVISGEFTSATNTGSFSHGTNPGFGGQANASTYGFCVSGAGSANVDSVFGCGYSAFAHLYGQKVFASGRFSSAGDAQSSMLIARNHTTNDTPTNLFLNGSNARLVIPAGKVFAFTAHITGIKSDGSAVAQYVRKGCIKRVVNTTSLVGSIETIGTDHEDNASTDVAITADDTNEALNISVTGIASETWRWMAVVEGVEIAYGS